MLFVIFRLVMAWERKIEINFQAAQPVFQLAIKCYKILQQLNSHKNVGATRLWEIAGYYHAGYYHHLPRTNFLLSHCSSFQRAIGSQRGGLRLTMTHPLLTPNAHDEALLLDCR